MTWTVHDRLSWKVITFFEYFVQFYVTNVEFRFGNWGWCLPVHERQEEKGLLKSYNKEIVAYPSA